MDIPRFEQHRRSDSTPGNLGDAFQVFIHELLAEDYPGLHFFPAGGKDGGIDLAQSLDGRRVVVECKYVGSDGLAEARRRWLEVAEHLREHLSEAAGPTPGQAQYAPWYRADPPIREYVFCISSELGNLRQSDALRQEITDFFTGLSADREHLRHLSGLSVKVLDWNDARELLRRRAHLLFRWFKLTRDYGLAPLDEGPNYATFRSYLFGDRLPYYSRRRHLDAAPAPEGVGVLDEEGLLNLVAGDHLTGLVLTGGGGVGKTRLTLELGWLAQSAGWVVLRVLRKLKEDALAHLAQAVTPETRVLLLIDYVETQRDFAELVDELNDLNDSVGLRLRYAANCRASYYSTIATTERHREVNLSPPPEDTAAVGWFEDYQHQTVRHILEHSGIEVTERHLEVCHSVPVLAVFMAYLQGTGRQTDLENLLEEQDFSRWLVKRLQLSFGDPTVSTTLAQLVALFPLPAAAVHHAELKEHGELFRGLATDRWIELLPADETREDDTWVTAHDVLADQILLSYFKSNPYTVENFVRGLLSLARRVGCLRPALITLQRLVDKPALRGLDWPKILDAAIAEDPPAWRAARDILVRTSLLTPLQTIDLLGRHAEVWQGAEADALFQGRVGWLTRWVLRQEALGLNEAQRSALESWLQRSAGRATVSNYVLTSGIKFCPELVREAALSWILTRPRSFQTHYLMVAWLAQGLPTEDIAPAVGQWSAKFAASFNLSFIARAWLDAKGDKELLRTPVRTWLAEHGAPASANFVYKAWLDAGGGAELIESYLPGWLAAHGTLSEARFVYQAWLDAGGGAELIESYLPGWLAARGTLPEAEFLYQSWLDAGGDKELVEPHLSAWVAAHGTLPEAQFVYKAWLDAGGSAEMVRYAMTAWLAEHGARAGADFVYKAWLDADGDKELVEAHLPGWLAAHGASREASFVYKSWLDAGGGAEFIKAHLPGWLAAHGMFPEAQFVYKAWLDAGGGTEAARESLLTWLAEYGALPEASFVYKSWLDAGGGAEFIKAHLPAWLAAHGTLPEARFVYKAWLDAGGSTELIESYLPGWLAAHGASSAASFVYKSWLDAGGGTELIRVYLLAWLDEDGAGAEVDFILKTWLERGGSFSVIRPHALRWLSRNYDKEEAVFLTKFIARQPDIPVKTVRDILNWCRMYPTNEDAIWRLTQLGRYLLIEEVAEGVCAACEAVLNPSLASASALPPVLREQITTLFSYLINSPGLLVGRPRGRVDELLLRWLRHPSSYGEFPRPYRNIQRYSYAQRVAALVDSGALSVTDDREALKRFMRWVNNWDAQAKSTIRSLMAELERGHPAPGVWDIVEFD